MFFIDKILIESKIITNLPSSVKMLKNKSGMYDIDINSIFFNQYSQALASKEGNLEDIYDKNKYNGAAFFDIGVEKVNLPISTLYPGQPGLESKNLLKILNADNIKSLPQAVRVKYQEKYFNVLIDGHHRVAAKILKGEKDVDLLLKVDNF